MVDTVLDEASLSGFLDAFYARVRRDSLIGPVFAAAIPEPDLKTGRYKGNPFGRHQALGILTPEHFARWLGLFAETANARFEPGIAALLIERAHRIGDSLKAGLFFRPEAEPGRP